VHEPRTGWTASTPLYAYHSKGVYGKNNHPQHRRSRDGTVRAEDPIDAFADIARTARDNAQAFLVKKDIAHFAPGAFENPEKAAAGAVVRFAHRYIQGIESEFTAYEYLQANGIQLLTTEEIGERLGITGTTEEIATKVERMDIDFMDTDGRTYQVKTGDNPNDYTVDTDYLVMVDGDTVKRYRQ